MLLRAVIGFIGIVGLATIIFGGVNKSFHDLSLGFALVISSGLLFARAEQLRKRNQPAAMTKPALVVAIITGFVMIAALAFVAGSASDTSTRVIAWSGVIVVLALLGAIAVGYRRRYRHHDPADGSMG